MKMATVCLGDLSVDRYLLARDCLYWLLCPAQRSLI